MRVSIAAVAIVVAAAAAARAQATRPVLIDLTSALYRTNTDETWRAYDALMTWSRSPNVLYFFAHHSDRPLGQGSIVGAALAHDWSPRFFTYSAFALAIDEAVFLPKTRADVELNLKFLPQKLVTGLGATRIRYPNDRGDDVFSGSVTYYGPLIFTYRYFRNSSDPGYVSSSSQMIQAALEHPNTRSAFLRFSWGNEAYLPTTIVTPEAVSVDGRTVTGFYRQWLTRRGGVIVEVEHQTKEEFRRSGGRVGVFYSF